MKHEMHKQNGRPRKTSSPKTVQSTKFQCMFAENHGYMNRHETKPHRIAL